MNTETRSRVLSIPAILVASALILPMTRPAFSEDRVLEISEDQVLASPMPEYTSHIFGKWLAWHEKTWTVAVIYEGDPDWKVRFWRYLWNSEGSWFASPGFPPEFYYGGGDFPVAISERFHAYAPRSPIAQPQVWVEPLVSGESWLQIEDWATAFALDDTYFAYGFGTHYSIGTVDIYEYSRDGSGWISVQQLRYFLDIGSTFGAVLALDGNLLAVGAPNPMSGHAGWVFVYQRDPLDLICPKLWCLLDELSIGQPADGFGSSLALAEGWLAVGTPFYDSSLPSFVDRGRVDLYKLEDGHLVLKDTITGAAPTFYFGASVSLTASQLLVGCPGEDKEVPPVVFEDVGAAYLYRRSGDQLHLKTKLVCSTVEPGSRVGATVGLTHHGALVGAPDLDAGWDVDSGAVLAYHGVTLVFGDGFESGDLTAWSFSVP